MRLSGIAIPSRTLQNGRHRPHPPIHPSHNTVGGFGNFLSWFLSGTGTVTFGSATVNLFLTRIMKNTKRRTCTVRTYRTFHITMTSSFIVCIWSTGIASKAHPSTIALLSRENLLLLFIVTVKLHVLFRRRRWWYYVKVFKHWLIDSK